jgi:hypothetical protein
MFYLPLRSLYPGASLLVATIIWSETSLTRLSVLVCEIVLLVSVASPSALLAQRGGHGAGAARPATGAPNPAPSNSDVSDFNRAIALQATPGQIARFQELTRSTQAARKQAQDLTQDENMKSPDSSGYAALNHKVEEAQRNNEQFVRSFTASQLSGLKPLTKKLSKSDADISKQSRALTRQLERSNIQGKNIASVVEKMDKALTGFQTVQLDIGKEMGVQPEGSSP